jgi:hypothetical protein
LGSDRPDFAAEQSRFRRHLPGYLAGWYARGHPNLEGYGWYRRRVALPAQGDLALLGPTMVDDGYEMFWNGKPIGGIGRLGHDPKVVGARPFLVRLPPSASERSALLAIRTFMQPALAGTIRAAGSGASPRSLPLRSATHCTERNGCEPSPAISSNSHCRS